ncbi:DUF3298 and DUF4163 domain-containing protein [Oscillospiraceae bacterium OttesenSCG-928-G22]|nr:DUF3298 and DUF4163 domain-containing protein [Oscillospiraceae bacterium OttesenSCG-928-G22]
MNEKQKTVPNVASGEIKKDFLYDSTTVIEMKITYPIVSLENKKIERRINGMYRFTADRFFRYVSKQFYREAVKAYQDAIRNDFPFHAFQAFLTYTETYFTDMYLSTYFDRYEYTGGAHGQTLRFSDTWNLRTGTPQELCDFFKSRSACYKSVLREILSEADERMKNSPGVLFDDYRKRIVKYFKPARYNLIPGGVAVYYQQYDIAPYSSGVVTFDIPFSKLLPEKEARSESESPDSTSN